MLPRVEVKEDKFRQQSQQRVTSERNTAVHMELKITPAMQI